MAGSAQWGHGFHQGKVEGRAEGALMTGTIAAAAAVGIWGYSKWKSRKLAQEESDKLQIPDDDGPTSIDSE
ncbi:hypothetical protein GCM10027417_30650 [Glutamicibacter endophyticus]